MIFIQINCYRLSMFVIIIQSSCVIFDVRIKFNIFQRLQWMEYFQNILKYKKLIKGKIQFKCLVFCILQKEKKQFAEVFFEIFYVRKCQEKFSYRTEINRNSYKLETNQSAYNLKMQAFSNFLDTFSDKLASTANTPTYIVIKKSEKYQLRKYEPWVIAETVIEGKRDDVATEGFKRIAEFIYGKNDKDTKIDMTAPVNEIKVSPERHIIQFYMPAQYDIHSIPKPTDDKVIIKQLPQRTMLVHKYRGGWSDELFEKELGQLKELIKLVEVDVKEGSLPTWSRYNTPLAPGFVCSNEVMLEVNEK